MSDPSVARAYLLQETSALEPLAFFALRPAGAPLAVVEIARREEGGYEVLVPGRPASIEPLPISQRSLLRDRGFASREPSNPLEAWRCEAADAATAVDLAQRVLVEVFAAKPDAALDIAHGSHRAEVDARKRLAGVRARLDSLIGSIVGRTPETDPDGDYIVPMQGVRVMVAPRVAPFGPVVVRVFAITNVGMTVTPELALFLARLNFDLMFGRFVLAADAQSIWFDETLLGEHLADEELRFTLGVVASTAAQWTGRLKQMFGGSTHHEAHASGTPHAVPAAKPGQGGYL